MFSYMNVQSHQTFDPTVQFPNFEKQFLIPRIAENPRSFEEQNSIAQAPLAHQNAVAPTQEHEEGGSTRSKPVQRSVDRKNTKWKGVVDTSSFTIEERLMAAVWVHERARSRISIGQIKRDFRHRFDKDPPTKNTLLIWEKKLFSTGNVMDAQRSGRPCQRKEHIDAVQASLAASPGLSLRARASALALPRTTLRKILCEDLRVDRQPKKKGKARNELSGVTKRKNAKLSPKPGKTKPKQSPRTKVPPPQPPNNPPPVPEQGPLVPMHHSQPQNHISYRGGYTDIVVPVHQFPPYVSYQTADMKGHMHHTNMSNVTSIPHQQYVLGPSQGHHMQ